MINERIQQLIDAVSGGNKRAFSLLIGVNPTVIENIVGTRKGKPGYDLLEKIVFSIENINIEWLFTGEGLMFKSQKEYEKQEGKPMMVAAHQLEYQRTDESLLYKMYKEKDEENKALLKEIGRLEERLKRCESSVPTVKAVSSTKSLSRKKPATSVSVQSNE